MAESQTRTLGVFAPAKINLYLHVTGRQKSGYHTIDSLAVFADVGDRIDIAHAGEFSFDIKGPFAGAFISHERDAGPQSTNLVPRAVWALSGILKKEPNFKVTLTKNLPLAAGMGGGSADAAAIIWGLLEWWDIPVRAGLPSWLPELLLSLGADVPACMACRPVHMRGIGDVVRDAPQMPEIPVLLVHPGKFCETREVFGSFEQAFSNPVDLPAAWDGFNHLYKFLGAQRNDLTRAAAKIVPEIEEMIALLSASEGCRLARMTGSGATCFGLFSDELAPMDAAENILREHPSWWVRTGTINRPQRY